MRIDLGVEGVVARAAGRSTRTSISQASKRGSASIELATALAISVQSIRSIQSWKSIAADSMRKVAEQLIIRKKRRSSKNYGGVATPENPPPPPKSATGVLISEVDLYTKLYYWGLRNCPDRDVLISEVKRGSTARSPKMTHSMLLVVSC